MSISTFCYFFWLKLAFLLYMGYHLRSAQYKLLDNFLITVCILYVLVVTLIALIYPTLPATPIVQGRRDTVDYTITYLLYKDIKVFIFWIFFKEVVGCAIVSLTLCVAWIILPLRTFKFNCTKRLVNHCAGYIYRQYCTLSNNAKAV